MKLYIAYRFFGRDKDELKDSLSRISKVLTDIGHETFIFCRDEQNWGEKNMLPEEILAKAFKHISECDGILALQSSQEKSEGLLLEVGYAKGLGKRIIVAVKEDIPATFLRCITDKVINYNSDEELLKYLMKIT